MRRARFIAFARTGIVLACAAVALSFACLLGGCGGSSSETPPPLEPTPANIHYNRSATTLPGEVGTPVRSEPPASAAPAPPSAPLHPLGIPKH